MQVLNLSAKGVRPFLHLIDEGVAKEIDNSLKKNKGESDLIGDGFYVYGAFQEEAGIPQGALAVQIDGYTVSIRSLFMKPEYRLFGGATMMLDTLTAEVLSSDDIIEIEFFADDSSSRDKEIGEFLKEKGFLSEKAPDKYYKTTLGAVRDGEVLSKYVGKGGTVSLGEVSDKALRVLGSELADNERSFIDLPIVKSDYDTDISTVTITRDKICDLVLVAKDEDGLVLEWVWAGNESGKVIKALAGAMNKAIEKYGPDTVLRIPTVNDVSSGLVEKIVEGAECFGFTRYYMPLLPVLEAMYKRKDGAVV
ncbi:MAG: hypothetical protein K5655_06355 [Lachnospiraceae bacterium]|nr:hypothetical protein [Lachnospiraceae bacterium]